MLEEVAPAALRLETALTIDPARVLAAWAPQVEIAAVARVEPSGAAWRLLDVGGRTLAEADIVCGPRRTPLVGASARPGSSPYAASLARSGAGSGLAGGRLGGLRRADA